MSQFFEYTDSGIRFKGFQDLRKSLVESWEATFGEDIDTSPTSPDGHHIDLEAATVNSVAEMLQAVANTMSRNQATGEYLDLLAAFLGLERADGESDASLRQRMNEADSTGLATLDAMRTYLRNNIAPSVDVLENCEPTESSDGIPGHHYRVVLPQSVYDALVEKADEGEIDSADDYVAQFIWICKPAGIKGDGNKTGHATDIVGVIQPMKFSITDTVGIDVKVVLSLYREESFPQGGTGAVADAIRAWAAGTSPWAEPEYTPGKDVLVTRFITPIMTVSGIGSATLQVRKHTEPESEWQSTDISIGSQEIAELVSVSVEVGE